MRPPVADVTGDQCRAANPTGSGRSTRAEIIHPAGAGSCPSRGEKTGPREFSMGIWRRMRVARPTCSASVVAPVTPSVGDGTLQDSA